MTISNYKKKLYQEFQDRYLEEGLNLGQDKFNKLISNATEVSKKTYLSLKGPKIIPFGTYNRLWMRRIVMDDFSTKAVRSFNTLKPPRQLKNTALFTKFIDPELVRKFYIRFYNARPEERKDMWEKLDLPIGEIENKFSEMIKERNENNKRKGYTSTINFYIKANKISLPDYEQFLTSIDKVVLFCNKLLPTNLKLSKWFYSEFNNYPCFICKLKSFPFKSLDDVFEKMAKEHKILAMYKNKIVVKEKDFLYSETSYLKENDEFEITINKNQNIRHRCLDLIHELGHVINNVRNFQKDRIPAEIGRYTNEKEAYKLELNFFKKTSKELYQTSFTQVLSNLVRVLFEMEFYTNPNQKPSKLFAKIFNKCFKNAKQKRNPLYLIEERVIFQPFHSFPHAVAEVNIINSLI